MKTLSSKKINQQYLFLLIILVSVVLMLNIRQSISAPRIITMYVAIDPITNTANFFNNNFEPMENNIYQFENDQAIWLLGVDTDVIRHNRDGSIDELSSNPAYTEMIHHVGLFYSSPNRVFYDSCSADGKADHVRFLVRTASEMASINFPKGYAYKLHGGKLWPGSWIWQNPAGVSLNDKIFVRLSLKIDDASQYYRDTNFSYFETTACGTSPEFNVIPGKSKKIGVKYTTLTKRRLVLIFVHIHDHVKELKVKSNNGTVWEIEPENQYILAGHDDVGQGKVAAYPHSGNLTVNSLTAWNPGRFGPVIDAGESLWVETRYNNPHSIDIDSMAVVGYFWEAVN